MNYKPRHPLEPRPDILRRRDESISGSAMVAIACVTLLLLGAVIWAMNSDKLHLASTETLRTDPSRMERTPAPSSSGQSGPAQNAPNPIPSAR